MTNKRNFKVGDKVRIRQWDDMKGQYGLTEYGRIATYSVNFSYHMRHLCGKTAAIKEIYYCDDGVYRVELKFDPSELKFAEDDWVYTLDMLEPIELDDNVDNIVIYRDIDNVIALDKSTGETAKVSYTSMGMNFSRCVMIVLDELYRKKEKYFTGKVVCIRDSHESFTVGKVYEFVDGVTLNDDNLQRPINDKIKTLDDWNLGNLFIKLIEN